MRIGLITTGLVLTLAACAQQPGTETPAPAENPGGVAFDERAAAVLEAWRANPPGGDWTDGFVPLTPLTVLPTTKADGSPLDEATQSALNAGYFIADADMTAQLFDADSVVEFADGQKLEVEPLDTEEAYEAISNAAPADCEDSGGEDENSGDSPDDTTTHKVPCTTLHVTGVDLGTLDVHTSRGPATVKAYEFTVDGLGSPIVHVAVHPDGIGEVPTVEVPEATDLPDIAQATDLVGVNGAELTYNLGVGECDTGIGPVVRETDEAIIVAGTAVTPADVTCIEILKYVPVTVTLNAPAGARPIIDAVSGQPVAATPAIY